LPVGNGLCGGKKSQEIEGAEFRFGKAGVYSEEEIACGAASCAAGAGLRGGKDAEGGWGEL
jgi:hypothetical protein